MRWDIFGGVFEYLFLLVVFGAYLFMLIWIVLDLFRDRALGGLAKAIWLVFLVFVPFVTALVYLIARGSGMADRAQARPEQAPEYSEEYVRSVSFASPADEIAKAKALVDQGILTPGEFDALKAKALGEKF
ncbi:SHOCT domain-containing protein [Conyzicola sp.]|uniref:SHOCT domain-containing protein n=1 Tax=Conyzicola sp. TaxID=1969404 RepID=UPI0039890287